MPCAVLLITPGGQTQIVYRAMSSRVAIYVGDEWHSWYLWPAIVFVGLLFPRSAVAGPAAAGAFLLALASYRLVERSTVRLALRPRTVVAIITCTTRPALVLATGVLQANAQNWHSPQTADEGTLYDAWSQCVSFAIMPDGPSDNSEHSDCTWNQQSQGRPIHLVGDSNAAHFVEATEGATRSLERPVTMRTAAGCPFADLFRRAGSVVTPPDSQCRQHSDSTVRQLKSQPSGTGVASNVEGQCFEDDMAIGPTAEQVTSIPTRRAVDLRSGLIRSVRSLRAAGHDVVLVEPVPPANYVGVQAGP